MENQLPRLRKALGLRQEELAQRLEVSRQTISAIENGKYNPSLDLAFVIADFFQLRIEDIFFPGREDTQP